MEAKGGWFLNPCARHSYMAFLRTPQERRGKGIVGRNSTVDVTPSASRLTSSLRDIGYDFSSALADLVDNSISAGASQIDIEICFEGARSYVLIADNGSGMTKAALTEALRFGTRRDYQQDELGRYGLGLKTASLSQCRRVTVVTRQAPVHCRISALTLDLDHIVGSDRWELIDVPTDTSAHRALGWLSTGPGTVVVWEDLDRILPEGRTDGGGAKRRLDSLSAKAEQHLGMVFHRFIEGVASSAGRTVVTVDGRKVKPWNPFAPSEEGRWVLPEREFELWVGDWVGNVRLSPVVLPARSVFSSPAEFDRMSGPAKWNRQQGLYIYRADRLIQSGGWCGIRAIDEHTKLARSALDFSPELDELFRINVAKMRVALPAELRPLIEPHVTDLSHRAQEMYRRDLREGTRNLVSESTSQGSEKATEIGAAIISAALATGNADALEAMITHLRSENRRVLKLLEW